MVGFEIVAIAMVLAAALPFLLLLVVVDWSSAEVMLVVGLAVFWFKNMCRNARLACVVLEFFFECLWVMAIL